MSEKTYVFDNDGGGLKEHCGAAHSTYAATDGAISAVYESDFRKRELQII